MMMMMIAITQPARLAKDSKSNLTLIYMKCAIKFRFIRRLKGNLRTLSQKIFHRNPDESALGTKLTIRYTYAVLPGAKIISGIMGEPW